MREEQGWDVADYRIASGDVDCVREAFGADVSPLTVRQVESQVRELLARAVGDDLRARVKSATTLDGLADLLRADATSGLEAIDWCDLPTFGGPDIKNPSDIWSWDAENVLIGSCAAELEIVPRGEVGAQ